MWTKASEYIVLGRNVKIGEYSLLGVIPKIEKITPLIIGDNSKIRSHSVIYTNTIIGKNFQTGHGVLIRENNKIGDSVSLGTHSVIERDVSIGNNVRMHSNVFIPELTIIEDYAWIGPNVVITNAYHPLCEKVKKCMKGPTIKKHAIIGANTTILPYITIGENTFIGAGSLVTKDVPDGMVATGHPAKIMKKRSELLCKTDMKSKGPYIGE